VARDILNKLLAKNMIQFFFLIFPESHAYIAAGCTKETDLMLTYLRKRLLFRPKLSTNKKKCSEKKLNQESLS